MSTYYAIPDPADPDCMTYWRSSERGDLAAWPAKARYAPALYRKDIPAEFRGAARGEWIRQWFAEHARPWWIALRAALDADPDGAAARFAAFTTRCCMCGRRLTDAASKVYGIGPDCRQGLPADLLAAMVSAVARSHLAYLAAAPTDSHPADDPTADHPAPSAAAANPPTSDSPKPPEDRHAD